MLGVMGRSGRAGAVRPPRRCGAWRAVALLGAALGSSGCAVGWIAVGPAPGDAPRAPRDWSGLHFAVVGSPGDRFAATRVLRARHGVEDVHPGPPRPGDFVLTLARGDVRSPGAALAAVSFFTFAAIPGVYTEEHEVRLSLASPGGARLDATGAVEERAVSWAPAFLLGANWTMGLNGGGDDADLDRLAAVEEVVGRFADAAEPFVAKARAEPAAWEETP